MRMTAGLFVGGAISLLIFKLLAAFVFPLLGALIGFLMMAVKLALLAAIVYFVYSMIFKKKKSAEVEVEG